LNIDHPANGNEYALGCGLCRHSANDPKVAPAKPNIKPPKINRPLVNPIMAAGMRMANNIMKKK
jgi:hypothetical protein